jgi:uncharacterized membrane protein
MLLYLKVYVAAFVAFLALDIVWLVFVARAFYRKQLGFLLRDQPNWWAAIAFYLLFVAGIVVFAVIPALREGSQLKAVLLGAFFGLVTYATYDLTNFATIKNWPWLVTVVDLCWGCILAASVSFVGCQAGQWMAAS